VISCYPLVTGCHEAAGGWEEWEEWKVMSCYSLVIEINQYQRRNKRHYCLERERSFNASNRSDLEVATVVFEGIGVDISEATI
jgi:hypothetical protein